MSKDAFGNYWCNLSDDSLNYVRALCEGGTNGGATKYQIKHYSVDPNAEGIVPDNLDKDAWAYAILGDGPSWGWDPVNHLWIIT